MRQKPCHVLTETLQPIQVTLVVQVTAPSSLQQYVHRVGRTARGGKEGRALLLLLQPEESSPGNVGWGSNGKLHVEY